MSNYVQIEFVGLNKDVCEILIAGLSESGFEGFEELDNGLRAFIAANNFNEPDVNYLAQRHGLSYTVTIIPETNWNEVWESNFEPVQVDDFVGVRAAFHEPMTGVEHELIITPKMSFGTGHHATTHLMIDQMRYVDLKDKKVFDFGTGTGVLAILAEKLGASEVIAVDIDEWSIRNAEENIRDNGAVRVRVKQAVDANTGAAFDVILTNINKNVIVDNFPALVNQLRPGAVMVLSGLVAEDKDDIFHICAAYSLQIIEWKLKDNWLCIRVSR